MTEQATQPSPNLTAESSSPDDGVHAEALSAWVDGEWPGQDRQQWWASAEEDAQPALQTWHRYHLIGDVLRATSETPFACTDAALSATQARASAQRIMAQAQAANVMSVEPVAQPNVRPAALRGEAANDGVFRWKMVSGFASVVAVVSLAWSLGASPTGSATAPVLAQSAPSATVAVASSQSTEAKPMADAVLVSTPHGAVLRDARLEELMLAHRQSGGASALQVPAGFLRNATFDATQR